ncbi:MAG: class I SAM-dependent methyltransferase [Syntrophomonas sp.]|nr:class I SAM-dependent methyltransferase [Syntrophomonas sp.]
MKEVEIRPDHLMVNCQRLREMDIKLILKKEDHFVTVLCPACGSNMGEFLYVKEGFRCVQCPECETIFINPRPNPSLLECYYQEAQSIKFWNDYIFPISEESWAINIFRPRAKRIIELCEKYGASKGCLVDVGAGFGTFCREIMSLEVFNRIVAVEPSPDLAASCRVSGIEVIQESIEKVNLDRVDVITCFELIEHLFCPEEFLRACAECLADQGIIICSTPNVKGFDLQVLGSLSDNIAGPNHLNYFHPTSLSLLFEKCGFKVLELLTPGQLDAEIVRKKILDNSLDVSNQPFLKQILIDKWEDVGDKFQGFLAENLLSSHMWVVAQKES